MLGGSGLEVSVLSFGTMTLGGEGRFAAMGNVQVDEARRLMVVGRRAFRPHAGRCRAIDMRAWAPFSTHVEESQRFGCGVMRR